MSTYQLSNIMMNTNEKIKTCIENLFLLFKRRNLIEDYNNNIIVKVIDEIKNNGKYIFNNIGIYFNDIEIKNISSGSDIDDFLVKNSPIEKFILYKKFSKKVYKQIQEYNKTYIFNIYEFLEDILSNNFIPEHKLLGLNEKEELIKRFKLEDLPKINNTDMISRYYGAKVNDVFRIKRVNLNSGYSIIYRVVINDNLIFFL